ncbi:MAG: HD family phosphohydrolase [Candidatus Cloacimonadaceae bacterium]
MHKKEIVYCFLFAFILTGIYNGFERLGKVSAESQYKIGQIAEHDITAPFNFEILKSQEKLKAEEEQIKNRIKPVYVFSDEVQFQLHKKINDIFLPLLNPMVKPDTLALNEILKENKIELSASDKLFLLNPKIANSLYNLLNSLIDDYYTKVIFSGSAKAFPDSITLFRNEKVSTVSTNRFISVQQIIDRVLKQETNINYRSFLGNFLPQILMPNLVKNDELYEKMVQQAVSSLPVTEGTVKKNEIIVRKNERITEDELNKINSLREAEKKQYHQLSNVELWLKDFGIFVYAVLLAFILLLYLKLFNANLLKESKYLIILLSGLVLSFIFGFVNNILVTPEYIVVPYGLIILSIAILCDFRLALFYNVIAFATMLSSLSSLTFAPFIYGFLPACITLVLMQNFDDKHEYFRIWLIFLLSSFLLCGVFSLFGFVSRQSVLRSCGYIFIADTLSVLILIPLVPILERAWQISTKKELLELLDFNHPLLKKLAIEASGTYYHSIVVGNLAERAAEAIGANSLIARVGSYYHDIGKLVNPQLFTENNAESNLIHDKLSPQESSAAIKDHVQKGIELAHKYHIPEEVTAIIAQHHGTTYIRYFLDKAEKYGSDFDLEEFKYGGPKPQSKEAVIVMIEDIVESVTKSWDEVTLEDIKRILNDTIFRLIKEGQFDEAEISLSDLNKIKTGMLPILESIYRKRQQYPETETFDE